MSRTSAPDLKARRLDTLALVAMLIKFGRCPLEDKIIRILTYIGEAESVHKEFVSMLRSNSQGNLQAYIKTEGAGFVDHYRDEAFLLSVKMDKSTGRFEPNKSPHDWPKAVLPQHPGLFRDLAKEYRTAVEERSEFIDASAPWTDMRQLPTLDLISDQRALALEAVADWLKAEVRYTLIKDLTRMAKAPKSEFEAQFYVVLPDYASIIRAVRAAFPTATWDEIRRASWARYRTVDGIDTSQDRFTRSLRMARERHFPGLRDSAS